MTPSDRWQIHRHLATDSNERLAIVRHAPQQISLIGADADISRSLLAARYPKAAFAEYDPRADFLAAAADARKSGFWQKLTGKSIPQQQQSLIEPLPEAAADMLWANLSLITAADLPAVFDNWARHLQTDGLLFFTHFGIDSLQDVSGRLNALGIACRAPTLIDMHDLGDMLFHHGFYDPVMDTAKLTLSYRSSDAFWQDMDTLGLWQALQFNDEAAARATVEAMWQSGELTDITLETIYGHAVKKLLLPEGEQAVQFFPKREN
ncbi:MAG: methyltransferase [Neisseria sp.]|nr:methyltransferase [Neisseria sp.]